VIDDERLQELLSKASSLYNNGEYKAAIETWQEALSVDPSSQKAREGIRMATLLLGDFEGPGAADPGAEAQAPADGACLPSGDMAAEEIEARIDLGLARIKQLLADRKFQEAIEGAQGLLPLCPESEEIQRLLEEAQQAFEAAPFIEEHLTLAQELLEQERFPEAEEECKKIFVLDATHPAGRVLMTRIRDRQQQSLQRAAKELGGMTVKVNLSEVLKKGEGARGRPGAGAPPPEEPTGLSNERILDSGDEPSIALAGPAGGAPPAGAAELPGAGLDLGAPEAGASEPPAESPGEAARTQEEVVSRSLLDAAFAQAGVGGPPAGTEDPAAGAPAPVARAGGGSAAQDRPEEFVEAKTIVPPTVRTAPAPPERPAPARPKGRAAVTQADMKPGPPPAAEPAGPVVVPEPASADEVAAWETELTQLNLKVGERQLLKGTGARAGAAEPPEAEADLMSLLDTNLGGPAGTPGGADEASQVKSIPLAGPAAADRPRKAEPAPAPRWTVRKSRETLAAEAAAARAAEAAIVHERARERRRPTPQVARRRSSAGRWLFLLLLLAAGGGGAWWFYLRPGATGLPEEVTALLSYIRPYLRPGTAGGAGAPQQPVDPPAGSSPGLAADTGQGPIPTPIGGPGRPAAQDGQGSALDGGDAAAAGASAGTTAGAAAPGTGAAGPGASGAGSGTGAAGSGTAAAAAPPIGVSRPEPIKPAGTPPPLSPVEIKRRLAYYSSDGRRLMSQGKLREARAKFNAALALDPANFELKELMDQVQAKLDEEQRLMDDFHSARQFYNDRDYENALRKLYRLPRDKGLGDIDLFIRNAWYNWAVIAAKGGNATDTLKKLDELLQIDPDDAEALKLQEVAEHYLSRAKDRVYYAFTEKLRLRAFEQR
jgi:tetratricopeptide (TPR) repeat protein